MAVPMLLEIKKECCHRNSSQCRAEAVLSVPRQVQMPVFIFGRIASDVFRERAIRHGLNLIAVFFCKTGCVIKKWFVSSISDAGKNNSQFWRIFVCSGSVSGSFVMKHLLMNFLKDPLKWWKSYRNLTEGNHNL